MMMEGEQEKDEGKRMKDEVKSGILMVSRHGNDELIPQGCGNEGKRMKDELNAEGRMQNGEC